MNRFFRPLYFTWVFLLLISVFEHKYVYFLQLTSQNSLITFAQYIAVYYACFTLTHGSTSSVHLKYGAECTECWVPLMTLLANQTQTDSHSAPLSSCCHLTLSPFSSKDVKHLLVQAPGSPHFTYIIICIWYSVSATLNCDFCCLVLYMQHLPSSFFSSYLLLSPSSEIKANNKHS